jgi:4-alpha-glucanotransferase
VQLYATRSRGSWGIGDLADLRAVRRMAADQGAGFLLINPLHAVAPTAGQEASPYLPATRRFRNPIYLRVSEVPGADGVDLEDDAGRALSDGPLIDRDAIWARKREVLMRIFFAHGGGEAFARWREEQGQTLQDWATWAAIAEEHGGDWHAWPEGLRRPQGSELARYVEQHGAVVAFHAWLQWALDLQFTAAIGRSWMTVMSPGGARTPGPGRRCSPRASASARPRTRSTRRARTGARRR